MERELKPRSPTEDLEKLHRAPLFLATGRRAGRFPIADKYLFRYARTRVSPMQGFAARACRGRPASPDVETGRIGAGGHVRQGRVRDARR